MVIGALWIVEIMGTFESNMIYAAVNHLRVDLGDPIKVGWLISSYLLVAAGAAAVAGRLGDIYGRKRVILILLCAGVIGSIMSVFAPNYATLLAGRALQGLCGAILPLTIGLARETLPAGRVSTGIGIMLSGTTVGTAAGLVVGGAIVDRFSWHGIFVASSIVGIVGIIAIMAVIPPSVRRVTSAKINWIEAVIFVAGVLLLVSAITYAPTWGFLNPWTLSYAIASVLLLALWVRISLTAKEPLLDVRLFKSRPVLVINVMMILIAMSTLQITLVFSTLMQAPTWSLVGLGATATLAGLAKLPSNVGSLFAGPLCGWLISKNGGRNAILVGGIVSTLGWVGAILFHDTITSVVIMLCIISFGGTMLYVSGPTILALTVPPERTSEAAGMTTVLRSAGTGIGAQVVTVLLATSTITSTDGSTHFPTESAFVLTMSVIACVCATAGLLGLALPKNIRDQEGKDIEP